eukprot:3654946-Pyramimonas_sp.AAC.1
MRRARSSHRRAAQRGPPLTTTSGMPLEEVRRADKSLRIHQAAGSDDAPPGIRPILRPDNAGMEMLEQLFDGR